MKAAAPILTAFLLACSCRAQAGATNLAAFPIDLPTAMRLVGAQNIDVQIAREKLVEARANHASALSAFFPWLAPGITYRQHNDKIQDVQGNIIDVDKFSYAPGATLGVQLDLGDAIYKSLASKQLAEAAGHALETQRQDSVLAAASGYYDLALAQAAVQVAVDSVRISSDFEGQLSNAVSSGLAFKGDMLRARVQLERNRLLLRQAQERQRTQAARLAEVLHLDPAVECTARKSELIPLSLIETNTALDSVVQLALATRSEARQTEALVAAALDDKNGAKYGPLIPYVGAQGFWGGLGGGRSGIADTFGRQEDYSVGIGWRVGPGGLFDVGRKRSAESRMKIAQLGKYRLRDEISRQAIEAFVHWRSLSDQLATSQSALVAAEEGLKLARERREFAVGVVLETIQAEQDLTRARLDFLNTVADLNKAQFALNRAIGKL